MHVLCLREAARISPCIVQSSQIEISRFTRFDAGT